MCIWRCAGPGEVQIWQEGFCDCTNSNQCELEDLAKEDKGNANPLETKSSYYRNGKLDDSKLCNDPKTNQDVEETSKEDFADAESSSNCNKLHFILTREAKEFSSTQFDRFYLKTTFIGSGFV